MSLSCRFCAHANPEGAKFCNECGSPLHLKPCPHCEAITDVSAENCHQCGAPFVSSGVAEGLAESAPDKVIDDVKGAEPELRAHIPESLAACLAEGGAGARARPDVVHFLGTNKADDSDALARAPDPDLARTTDGVVSSRKSGFYPASLGVAAVALAAVGYYAYFHGAPAMRALNELIVIARSGDDARFPGATPPATPPPLAAPVDTAQPAAPSALAAPVDTVPAPKYPGVAEPVDQPAAGLPRERSGGPVAEQAPKTQRLPVDEAASPTPRRVAPKAARGRKTPDTGAIATQRLVARDIQDLASPPDGAPSPLTTDRDAAATQRLIKRELGEFLPAPNVRSDGSSPTR